jgi:CheY-like chemotaxis protein
MPRALEGIYVLLVEDDGDSLALMTLVMEQQGALVAAASDPGAALSLLAVMKPDVLVTDISMPGRDGWWLLSEARRRGHLLEVPALAVTALKLTPEEVRQAGFNAYLRKPVDPDRLSTTVQALARGQRPAA